MGNIECVKDLGRPLGIKEVAVILGVSAATVRRYADNFGCVRVGRKFVFYERPLMEALRANFKVNSAKGDSLRLPGFSNVGVAHALAE